MKFDELFLVLIAVGAIWVLSVAVTNYRRKKNQLSTIYISAHHTVDTVIAASVSGYTTLTKAAEATVNAAILSADANRDDAIKELDRVAEYWQHVDDQIKMMIEIDAANIKSLSRRHKAIIADRHEKWRGIQQKIATTALRHAALRCTYVNNEL
jgi:hypothetical protein